MSNKNLYEATDYLLKKAKQLGADSADCACESAQSLNVSVRMGALENVEREESISAGLRVIIGKKQAGATTSSFTKDSLDILAERVVFMAKVATEDKYCTIAEENDLAKEILDLNLVDKEEPSIEFLETAALECESGALGVNGITNIAGCGTSWGINHVVYSATNGFNSGYAATNWSVGVAAIALKDEDMVRDYETHNSRFKNSLKNPKHIGQLAGERTIKHLGAKKINSQKAPVILENRVASSLLKYFSNAISGNAIARGVSFLRNSLETQVFHKDINIIDDPFIQSGFGSKPFDGEGVKVSRQSLIENGVLTSWLLNSACAKQLGLKTNGHATMNIGGAPSIGTSNLILLPSSLSLEQLFATANNGIFVTETMSPSFNSNTGDYSVGVSGFKIENGVLTHAVNEITIAGNLLEIFKTIIAGNDLEGKGSTDCPSLLIENMMIAGI